MEGILKVFIEKVVTFFDVELTNRDGVKKNATKDKFISYI